MVQSVVFEPGHWTSIYFPTPGKARVQRVLCSVSVLCDCAGPWWLVRLRTVRRVLHVCVLVWVSLPVVVCSVVDIPSSRRDAIGAPHGILLNELHFSPAVLLKVFLPISLSLALSLLLLPLCSVHLCLSIVSFVSFSAWLWCEVLMALVVM